MGSQREIQCNLLKLITSRIDESNNHSPFIMILKPNEEIEKYISETLKEGWDNSYIHTRKTDFGEMKFIRLKKTSLMFVYGWSSENEFWLLSDN